ncbi:MAG: hypothetical protein HGA39_02600 [Coriobacteriia bacterium]|nr:hypothetical protein [Coriobacteriia bacterium]
MSTRKTVDQILSLLNDENFVQLRYRASRTPILWEDFLRMETPAGLSHEEAWAILNTIRRQTAIYFAVPSYKDSRRVPAWYMLPHSSVICLHQIEGHCGADSQLHLAIAERAGKHFVIQSMIEEAIASARRDGLDVDYESAREVLRGERSPSSCGEQLILNNHQALCDLEQYAGREFTPDLIRELHSRLTEGVSDEATTCKPRPLPIVKPFEHGPAEILDYICSLANGTAGDPAQHSVVTAMCIQYSFWDFQPFAYWNSMVESIVTRLYLIKRGYPVLQYLPLSKATLDWEDGLIRPPSVLCSFEDARLDCDSSEDLTLHIAVLLQLMLKEVAVLERTIATMQARDDHLHKMLSCDPTINPRQRTILNQALRTPDREFKIGTHRAMHQIAYATARADLLGLVDHGFFRKEQNDKAFVFRACPDLKTLIENHRPRGR